MQSRLDLRSTWVQALPGLHPSLVESYHHDLHAAHTYNTENKLCELITNYIMTREKEHSDSTLMPTTETMRNKADFVKKGFIYILKCLRCSKCTKGHGKESKPTKQKHRDGEA